MWRLLLANITKVAFSKVLLRRLGLFKGLGTTLTEGAMKASYFKMNFHESYATGYWCQLGLQNCLIRH